MIQLDTFSLFCDIFLEIFPSNRLYKPYGYCRCLSCIRRDCSNIKWRIDHWFAYSAISGKQQIRVTFRRTCSVFNQETLLVFCFNSMCINSPSRLIILLTAKALARGRQQRIEEDALAKVRTNCVYRRASVGQDINLVRIMRAMGSCFRLPSNGN